MCTFAVVATWTANAAGQKLVWEGMADHNAAASHVSPCQSTGVWFSEPTPASLRFLGDFLDFLLNRRLDQWDQAAWNEVSSPCPC